MCRQSKLLIILLCVKYSLCNFSANILGGEPLKIEQAPYSAQFYNAGGFCGSSVLTSWALLTAAHCFEYNTDVGLMVARVGTEQHKTRKGDNHRVIKVTIHRKYNKGVMFSHDIALVFLETHLKLRSTVQRALVTPTGNFLKDFTPKAFRVSGWGWTSWPKGKQSEQGLMGVNLTLVGIHRCSKLHNTTLSHDMFCLYGGYHRDSCKGDSGGGIMWKTYLVGIVSHGDGCGLKNKPGIYANVFHFRRWIMENLLSFRDKHCTHKSNKKLKIFLRSVNDPKADSSDFNEIIAPCE